MILPDELASMRGAIKDLLPDTCTVLAASYAANGEGGFTETWGTVSAGVPCRLDMQSGREALNAESLLPYSRWVLTAESKESISTANRIIHGGITYNVVSVNAGASWRLMTRCVLEKVNA